MQTALAPVGAPGGAGEQGPSRPASGRWVGWLALAGAVAVGVAVRAYTRSDLWLDEALSVNIARLPLSELFEALRHDGHPPLYYLLLHGWIEVFGDGDEAVRSLSALLSVATLPVAWVAGRRYGGQACAVATVVLLATSPFAVRYATEARMYSLVILLVFAGWLAVRRALEDPSLLRLVPVALVSGLLLLTHYWSVYLLAAVALLLAWRAWFGPAAGRQPSARTLAALAAGGVLFLPWLPSFLEQAAHTGTPWGRPERPGNVVMITLHDFGGGPFGEAQLLGTALLLLALLALLARAVDADRLELDLRTRRRARPECIVVAGTLGLAVVAGYATGSAFASRYSAVVLPLVLLLAGLGTTVFLRPPVRVGILVVLAVTGLWFAGRNVVTDRTQAGAVADVLQAQWRPGDVVAYCPDQLGPAVSRLLPAERAGVTYPTGTPPDRVDWAGYARRMAAGDPVAFAGTLDQRAGPGTVWLVWSSGYRTLGRSCEELTDALADRRGPPDPSVVSGSQFEHAWLFRYAGT